MLMQLRISIVLLFSATLIGCNPLAFPFAPFGKNAVFPCVPPRECARVYGTDPLDVARFGNVPPCSIGLVRCVTVKSSSVQRGRVPVGDPRQISQNVRVVNQAPRRAHPQTTTTEPSVPTTTTTTLRTTSTATTTTQSPFRFLMNDFGSLSIEPEVASGTRNSKSLSSAVPANRVMFGDFVTPPAPLDLDPTPNSYIERMK